MLDLAGRVWKENLWRTGVRHGVREWDGTYWTVNSSARKPFCVASDPFIDRDQAG